MWSGACLCAFKRNIIIAGLQLSRKLKGVTMVLFVLGLTLQTNLQRTFTFPHCFHITRSNLQKTNDSSTKIVSMNCFILLIALPVSENSVFCFAFAMHLLQIFPSYFLVVPIIQFLTLSTASTKTPICLSSILLKLSRKIALI